MTGSFFRKTMIALGVAVSVGTTTTIVYSEQTAQDQRQMTADQKKHSANFYDRKAEGYYWYDDPKAKVPEKKPPQVVAQPQQQKKSNVVTMQKQEPVQKVIIQKNSAPETAMNKKGQGPDPMSAEWLRDNLPKALDRAIDNPTNPDGSPSKDVVAYMYMQRILMDKAQNFSTSASRATQLDPLLDESNRIPLDTGAVMQFNRILDADREDAMKYISKKAGLWFFFDSTCSYCVFQLKVLDRFNEQYDFSTLYISMDNKPIKDMKQSWKPDRGQAKMLNLKITPTLVLVVPPNNFYIVSQGASSVDTLKNKILLASTVKNLLPKDIKEKIDPYSKGVLTAEQMKRSKEIQDQFDKDPTVIVDYIQKALGNK